MPLLRRLIQAAGLLACLAGAAPPPEAAPDGFTVATWNLRHFPSRNRNVKAEPATEKAAIRAAAEVLRADPPDILCLQEVRDLQTVRALLREAGMTRHRAVLVTAFTETRSQESLPLWENLALVSRFPVRQASTNHWEPFGNFKKLQRGFLFAEVQTPSGPVHVYTTHLLSNHGTGSVEKPSLARLRTVINARQGCMRQMVEAMRRNGSLAPGVACVLAGDLNTQDGDARFADETTLRQLRDAGLEDSFRGMERRERVTIPAGGGYPDATFDYLWRRGLRLQGKPLLNENTAGSDHRMVTARFLPAWPVAPAPEK